MSTRPRKLSQLSNDRREPGRRQQSSPTVDPSLHQQLVLDDNVKDIEQHQNIISRFTVNIQQEPQSQYPKGRQILVPKSRVSKLKPTHRHLPTSRQVNQEGPVYNADGTLKMRRPILLLAEGERMSEADFGDLDIDITDSYVNDQGYDLVNQEVGSSYCQSFDLDMLPDAPERRMSPYNMSKKEEIVMKPLPGSSKQSIKKEDGDDNDDDDGSMQVEIISSNEDVIEEKEAKKRSVEFYIKMLTRRSNSNHITPASSRPTSIAAVPVAAQDPDQITEIPKQQVLPSTRQVRRRYTIPSENATEKRTFLPSITADPLPRHQQQHIPLQVVAEDDSDAIKYASTSASSLSSSASSLWSCHGCGVKVLVSESTDCLPSNCCCWPITCCSSANNTPQIQPRKREAAASAVSRQQHVQPGGQISNADNKIFHSLTSSWAHIYRLPRRRRGGASPSRRSTNATKVKDAVIYPFRLGYNCFLWWLGPCISLGHECRGMCGSCHCCYYE